MSAVNHCITYSRNTQFKQLTELKGVLIKVLLEKYPALVLNTKTAVLSKFQRQQIILVETRPFHTRSDYDDKQEQCASVNKN